MNIKNSQWKSLSKIKIKLGKYYLYKNKDFSYCKFLMNVNIEEMIYLTLIKLLLVNSISWNRIN